MPEPGYKPRAKPMRQQIMFDVPAGLPHRRDQAGVPLLRRRPAGATAGATPALLQPRDADDEPHPGARASGSIRGRRRGAARRSRSCRARSRSSPRSPRTRRSSSASSCSLDKPVVSVGRRADNDLVVPEATVSGQHAVLKWQNATWIVEDAGSTNGTYVDHTYERRKSVNLMHGGEVQLGELRFKLVSFARDGANHQPSARLSRKARRPHRASHPRAAC